MDGSLKSRYRKQELIAHLPDEYFIDAACSTQRIVVQILDWEMLEAETLTELLFIT